MPTFRAALGRIGESYVVAPLTLNDGIKYSWHGFLLPDMTTLYYRVVAHINPNALIALVSQMRARPSSSVSFVTPQRCMQASTIGKTVCSRCSRCSRKEQHSCPSAMAR